jgi:Flp pilus assembly protein TadG
MRRLRQQDSEQGIASAMVALLAVALIGAIAFAVDFGIAYWNRNTLQTVTDSGSLAAAQKLAEYRGTCAQVKADPVAVQAAYDAAVQKLGQNRWFQTVNPRQLGPNDAADGYVGFEITCTASGTIEVEFWADGVSPAVLGPIAGSGPVTTVAAAAAEVGVPDSGFGLRPYFVCSNALTQLKNNAGNLTGWVRLQYPDPTVYDTGAARTVNDGQTTDNSTTLTSATADFTQDEVGAQVAVVGAAQGGGTLTANIQSVTSATQVELTAPARATLTNAQVTITPVAGGGPCFAAGGSWWTSDCPTDGNNGTLAENTARGCLTSIKRVNTTGVNVTDQSQMVPVLQAACAATNANPEDCLGGNPGNVASNNTVQAWDSLLGTDIALPVFNNNWQKWLFDSGYRCGQNGNNACYPVQDLLAVRVCGYEWGGNKDNSSPDPECAGVAALFGTGGNDNFLYLKLVNVLVGNVDGAFTCPVGDPICDLGVRAVRLVK